MQVSSAASTALNAAVPAVVGAGASAGTEGDPPFAGLLGDMMRPPSIVAGSGPPPSSMDAPILARSPSTQPSVRMALLSVRDRRQPPVLIAQPPTPSSASTATAASRDPEDQNEAANAVSDAPAKPDADGVQGVRSTAEADASPAGLQAAVMGPTSAAAAIIGSIAEPADPSGDPGASQAALPSGQTGHGAHFAATPGATPPSPAAPHAATQTGAPAETTSLSPAELQAPPPDSATGPSTAPATTQQPALAMQAQAAPSSVAAAQGATTAPPPAPPLNPVSQFTGRVRGGAAPGVSARTASGADRSAATASAPGAAEALATSPDAHRPPADATTPDPQPDDQDTLVSTQGEPVATNAADAAQQTALAPAGQSQTAPTSTLQTAEAALAQAAPETVVNLAAQIVQKSGGQTTRFDVQLDPLGLGRVNVAVEIDATGAMSAALSFENPDAASLLKTHAAELRRSLAQAGFTIADGALSFSTAAPTGSGSFTQAGLAGGGDGSGGQPFQDGSAPGRLFGAANLAADQTDQINTAARTLSARGLDIRI